MFRKLSIFINVSQNPEPGVKQPSSTFATYYMMKTTVVLDWAFGSNKSSNQKHYIYKYMYAMKIILTQNDISKWWKALWMMPMDVWCHRSTAAPDRSLCLAAILSATDPHRGRVFLGLVGPPATHPPTYPPALVPGDIFQGHLDEGGAAVYMASTSLGPAFCPCLSFCSYICSSPHSFCIHVHSWSGSTEISKAETVWRGSCEAKQTPQRGNRTVHIRQHLICHSVSWRNFTTAQEI